MNHHTSIGSVVCSSVDHPTTVSEPLPSKGQTNKKRINRLTCKEFRLPALSETRRSTVICSASRRTERYSAAPTYPVSCVSQSSARGWPASPPSHCCTNTRVAVAGNGRPSNPIIWVRYSRRGREICCQKAGTVLQSHLYRINSPIGSGQQRKGGERQGSFIRAARLSWVRPGVQTSAPRLRLSERVQDLYFLFLVFLRFSQFHWTEEFRLGKSRNFPRLWKYLLLPTSREHWLYRIGGYLVFSFAHFCRRWPGPDHTKSLRHPEAHRAALTHCCKYPTVYASFPLQHTHTDRQAEVSAPGVFLRDMPGTA